VWEPLQGLLDRAVIAESWEGCVSAGLPRTSAGSRLLIPSSGMVPWWTSVLMIVYSSVADRAASGPSTFKTRLRMAVPMQVKSTSVAYMGFATKTEGIRP
jgi:hypothetical protein